MAMRWLMDARVTLLKARIEGRGLSGEEREKITSLLGFAAVAAGPELKTYVLGLGDDSDWTRGRVAPEPLSVGVLDFIPVLPEVERMLEQVEAGYAAAREDLKILGVGESS